MLTIETLWQHADINALCARAGYAEEQVDSGARQHFLNGVHSAAAALLDLLKQRPPMAWLVTGSLDFEDGNHKTAERADRVAASRMDGTVAVPVYRLPIPAEVTSAPGDAAATAPSEWWRQAAVPDDEHPIATKMRKASEAEHGDCADVMRAVSAYVHVRDGWSRPYNREMERPITERDLDEAANRLRCAIRKHADLAKRTVSQGAMPPTALLADDHSGFRVNYVGLLDGVQRRLQADSPGEAELIRQLYEHLTELGQRWYRGDTAVVDEVLQLYCIERDARLQAKQTVVDERMRTYCIEQDTSTQAKQMVPGKAG